METFGDKAAFVWRGKSYSYAETCDAVRTWTKELDRLGVIPMPESSDLSLMTDRVGKGWFSMPCHRSELIGSGINRLKMIKRQMFGRANFDLLNRRFIFAA